MGLESRIGLGLEVSRQFYFIKFYLIQILSHLDIISSNIILSYLDFISSRFYFIKSYFVLSKFYFIYGLGLKTDL